MIEGKEMEKIMFPLHITVASECLVNNQKRNILNNTFSQQNTY